MRKPVTASPAPSVSSAVKNLRNLLVVACCLCCGTPAAFASVAGAVAHYEYSPFGEIVAQSGELAGTFTHRFSTKPYDPLTGIAHYQLRPYSPSLGRFMGRDPVGELGGLNLYRAARNDLVNHVDAFGLDIYKVGGRNDPPSIVAQDPSTGRIVNHNIIPSPITPSPVIPDPAIGENVGDPVSSHCFNEGWFRHCVSSCKLNSMLRSFSNGIPFTGLIPPVVTTATAWIYGGDAPWSAGADPMDREANYQGIINSYNSFGKCSMQCYDQFYSKLNSECCPNRWHLRKDDERCCGNDKK